MSDTAIATEELAKCRLRYANDEITAQELEDQVAFWLRVEDCEKCEPRQICSRHYTEYSGR